MLKILKNLLKTTNHGLNSLQSIWPSKSILTILAWTEWPDADARARKASALESYREQLADKLVYHRVTQYFFFQQWLKIESLR